ncbi:MAG: hypothetical protein KFF77_11150 [Bacteroidetes bacterium]|nr:hypothetical protein [Bacteroidota bacterium]
MRLLAGVLFFLAASAVIHAQPSGGRLEAAGRTFQTAVIPNRGMQAGTNNWMQIPDNPGIAIPVFTVETWVRATSGGLIVTRDVSSGSPSDWQLWYDYSRYRLAFITARTPPDSYFFTPDNSFMPGQWYHVALVVNGPAGRARLYIDGNLVISPTFTSRYFDCSTGLAWCGYYNNAAGAYLQGEIDEARYWNVERSEAEIRATKDIDLPTNDRIGLVGWWRFCDSYEDYSGSGNHGTPMGSPQLVLNSLPFGITCNDSPCDTLDIAIEGATAFCEGDSTILAATEGYRSYRWSTGDTTRSIVVRSAGRYRVDAVFSDSCIVAAEIEVRLLPAAYPYAGPDRLTCRGVPVTIGAGGHIPGYRYQWLPPTGLSNPDSAITEMEGDASRTYVLTVTNADGCSASDTVRVQVLDGLPIALPDSLHICPGTSVALPLDVLGGFPPFRYEWSPSDDLSDTGIRNPVATPSLSRWYRVVVTDSLGCTATDSILIVTSEGLDLLLPDSLLACKGATVILPLSVRNGTPPYTYRWTPPDGLDRDDVQTPRCTADTTRWYHVSVLDSAGCEGSDSVLVRVRDDLDTWLPDTITICAGASVQLPLVVTGQTGKPRFQWTPSDGLDRSDTQRPVARPTTPTMYHVRVIDSLGCEAEDSVYVRLFPGANVSITIDGASSFCVGDSVRLVATPGFRSYRWYTPSRVIPDTGNSIIAREAGNYRVAVIDSNGCEVLSQPVTISTFYAFEIPVTINGSQPLCEGDTLLLEAGGGYRNYVWMDDSGRVLGTGREIAIGRAVRVRVYARDSQGCVGRSREIEVSVAPTPGFSISGPRLVCIGSVHDYATLLRSRWEYLWAVDSGVVRGSDTRESIRIEWNTAGRRLLRLRVRDTQTGCEATVSVDVTVITGLDPRILATTPTVICDGDSVVLRSRDAHPLMSWRDANGMTVGEGRSVAVRRGGWYFLHAETDDGCHGIDSIFVTVLPIPAPRITGPVVVCVGDTAVYQVLAGGGGILRWESDEGVRLAEDSVGIVQHWTQPGRFRIVLVASFSDTTLRCWGSDTLEVEVQQPPFVALTVHPDSIICEGDSVRLSATPGLARYVWLLPDGTVDTTSNVLVVRGGGSYRVRSVSSGGCVTESDAVTVRVLPAPDVRIAGPTSACTGGIAGYSVPDVPGTSFQWSVEGGTFESGSSGAAVDVRWGAAGRARIILVADNGRCQSRDTLLVAVGDSVRPGVFPAILRLCPEGEGTLRAEDGFDSYTWLTPDGAIPGREITVRHAGLYRVHVSTDGGCEGTSDPIPVEILPAPEPRILGPEALCPGDTIVLQASPGYLSYRWSDGRGGRVVSIGDAAELTVTVTDSNGCAGTSPPHRVRLSPLPDSPGITRDGMTLLATPAPRYQWFRNDTLLAGETGQRCPITLAGEYRVVVWNGDGCPASSSLPVSCVTGRSLVSLPHLVVRPGDTVRVIPELLEQGCLEEIGARSFLATMRYEQSAMVPLDGTDAGGIDGPDRVITVRGTLQEIVASGIDLRFLATLGLRDSVPLVLESFEWLDVPVTADRRDGSLRVLICHEGGDRLFDGAGQVRLLPNSPNPFNTMTTVSFELIERAPTEVQVLDMLGRRVRTLFSGIGETGVHRLVFDAGALPSGQYMVVLRTPTVMRKQLLLLLK